jgi:hypothetical protein
MKPRLYLETTIPSYLVARPSLDVRRLADQQATHEWRQFRRHEYEMFISETVLLEISRAGPAPQT